MNSAADVRRFHEQATWEKHKSLVIDALNNDELGLSISQLATVCRLSVKTVKNILATIDVREEYGIYQLADAPVPVIPMSPKSTEVKQVEQVEQVEQPKPIKRVNAVKPIEGILKLLGEFESGLSKVEIMKTLELTDKQFTNAIYQLNKESKIQRFGTHGNYSYKLNDGQEMKTELPAAPETPVIEKNEVQQAVAEKPTQQEEQPDHDAISALKSQIKTVVTTKSHLTIKEDDLSALLSDLFGLNTVNFCIDAGRLVGVNLSDEVVA